MATVDQTEQENVQGQADRVKLERNSRGYNWGISLNRREDEDDEDWLDRLATINRRLMLEYGQGF